MKLTTPPPNVLAPVFTSMPLNSTASVALKFVIEPERVESLPPTDDLRQPPVGQDLGDWSEPSGSAPSSFNFSVDFDEPLVPGEAFTFTLAPKVVLEPTVSDEEPPSEELRFSVEPLMDCNSSPVTKAGSSTVCALKGLGAAQTDNAPIEKISFLTMKNFMDRIEKGDGIYAIPH